MSELKNLIDTFSGLIDELSMNYIFTDKEMLVFSEIEGLIKGQEKKIFDLYKLLDDIDTGSDLYKDNTKGYLKFVRALHNKRFDVVDETESDRLYGLYYKIKEAKE